RVSLLKQLSHCFVVPVDIFEEEYLAILLGNRRAIDDQHGNLVCQIYLLFLFCLKRRFNRKRLTNTPVRQAGSVLECPDDRKNRVVSVQATYTNRSSAVGGRVCEQRYAAERVLPESRFELQHAGSPSEKAALEEKAQTNFFGRSFGAGGVGRQEIPEAARTELWAGRSAAGRAADRGAS